MRVIKALIHVAVLSLAKGNLTRHVTCSRETLVARELPRPLNEMYVRMHGTREAAMTTFICHDERPLSRQSLVIWITDEVDRDIDWPADNHG